MKRMEWNSILIPITPEKRMEYENGISLPDSEHGMFEVHTAS